MTLSNAQLCLLQSGKILDLTTLLNLKKFRHKGNKPGALAAMRMLEREGLGKLIPKCARRGASTVSLYNHCNKLSIGYKKIKNSKVSRD